MLAELLFAQMTLTINAGGVSSLGSQDSYSISPTANIEVQAKLAELKYVPRLNVLTSLSALPGESVNVSDVKTFRSIEFEAGFSQPIPGIYAQLYAGFGFATRLPGDSEPRVSAAKFFSAGALFSTDDKTSYLYIGGGPDQRLNSFGYYEATAHIEGKVKITEKGKAKLSLIGNAILGSNKSLVRVGIVIGI